MTNVVIIKQPLYGSVFWNGIRFVYTPNENFTGNDTYTYKYSDNEGTKVLTNYINPSNKPPLAKNITVDVLANDLKEIHISELSEDPTNPFDYLNIVDVKSDVKLGSVRTDGKKIYFVAGFFNTVEYVDYTVSDKEYESSGRITFNVIGGINPITYKGSPYARMNSLLNKLVTVKSLSAPWTSMYSVMTSRGPVWDNINYIRYNSISDVVSGEMDNPNFSKWNSSYLNVEKFEIFKNAVSSNSGKWENYRTKSNTIYDTISTSSEISNSIFDKLLIYNPLWSYNTYNIQALSSKFNEVNTNLSSVSSTTSINSSTEWDTTLLNSISSLYFDKWNLLDDNVILNGNYIKWNKVTSDFNSISSDIDNKTNKIQNTFNVLTDLSGYYNASELKSFSASNFNNWNSAYQNINLYKNNWDNNKNRVDNFYSYYFNNVDEFKSTFVLVQETSSSWNIITLSSLSANNFKKWSSTYSLLYSNNNLWYNQNKQNFITNYKTTSSFKNTYNLVNSESSNWDQTIFKSYSALNFPKWNSVYKTINDNIGGWGNFTYNELTSFSAAYYGNADNFNSTHDTVNSKSILWGHTSFDSYSASNYPLWNTASIGIDKKQNSSNNVSSFSGVFYSGFNDFNSVYSTVSEQSGSNWDLTFTKHISGYIPLFNVTYNKLINENKYINWNKSYDETLIFNESIFNNILKYYDSYYSLANNLIFWNDESASATLSTISSNIDDSYNTVYNLSSKWFFIETPSLENTESLVKSSSAKWDTTKTKIDNSNLNWSKTFNTISSISANSLSGNPLITLSTNNINVYGNTNIRGNLSALRKKINVNTSLYTISGFQINNSGNTFGIKVSKSSQFDKAILNLNTSSSTVLYVKTSNSVFINLSSCPLTNSLVVSGNISASGFIYPVDNTVTTFVQNSAKYESTYSYVTSTSSNIYSFSALSANYNTLANYINLSSNKLTQIKNNKSLYDLMLNYTQSNSAQLSSIYSYVSGVSSNFDMDAEYRQLSGKYENTYSYLSSLSSLSNDYNINVMFAYPDIINNKTVYYNVDNKIQILSWTVISDVATTVNFDILSGSQSSHPTYVTVSVVDKPLLSNALHLNGKNTSTNVGLWKKIINKDSILKFVMTNNSTTSAVMLSLKVKNL